MLQKNSLNKTLPDFLEPWRGRASTLGCQGIQEVLFSGSTYQIEVEDLPLARWVFLQLGEDDSVKDIFCSCDESTERGSCLHMAASVLFVFAEATPLHKRFEDSFWHHLFFAKQEGCASSKPYAMETASGYELFSQEERLLAISGGSQIRTLISNNVEETEETSLKFSRLSEEELRYWREGRPSLRLRYELSLLSDIAKWLFLQQECGKPYKILFQERKERPEGLVIECEKTRIELALSQHELEAIIPSLQTVKNSSLSLLELEEICLLSLHFDQKEKAFVAKYDEARFNKLLAKPHRQIGEWNYFPGVGFLVKGNLPCDRNIDMDTFLDRFPALVQEKVAPVSQKKVAAQYQLSFDRSGALHIEGFLSKPKDLLLVGERWAFSREVGFVRLEPLQPALPQFVVSPEVLDRFLRHHRYWMSQFPGFAVHLVKPQEEIIYEVAADGSLLFHSIIQKKVKKKAQRDLEEWIYIEDSGFYVKQVEGQVSPLPLDEPIVRHQVADFIRHHVELLQGVQGFFCLECPIKQMGFSVTLKKKGLIEILPEYEWVSEKEHNEASFYEEYLYLPEKGFYRLPPHLRPQRFIHTISQSDTELWNSFFQEQLARLKAEYPCHIDKRLEKADSLDLTVVPEGDGRKISDYALDLFWVTKKGRVTVKELVAAKRLGTRFVPTEAGLIDLTEDRFQWLDILQEKKAKEPRLRLEPADFLRIQAYDPSIRVETAGLRTKEAFKRMLEKLLIQVPFEAPEIASLNCELRPYQLHGVHWLWFLYLNSLSGLLCDDMGVGKTHQAMGLMDAISHFQKKEGKKSLFLVVCPTSLVYHWQEKLERFLPSLRVKAYIGFGRVLDDISKEGDILLTTYGILRNESNRLRKYFFDAAFFDELQIAKNHVSQVHRALLAVQAHVKIGLTGTPIENNLRELKALFDIILPGYMPEEADFREFFMRPIERMEKPERKELLSRFVKPFILRRRKIDVLPDLPEKSEEICYADLRGEQKSLYHSVASLQAAPLIQQLRDDSLPVPYMHIFALLSSLKQICNHPAAYLRDMAHFEQYESGKWDIFVELLEEAQGSEQKVVVFSQYLNMLDIMEAFCKKQGIGYAQIRGQTKNRAQEVERFQNDRTCTLFLGSLQAAGLGIDLTAASVVIHYDRWWNAARENQATDRVHRMGQTRGVEVFKLLTKATIEEHIDKIIVNKAGLFEDVVSFDDHRIVKRLSRQQIISLLEGVPEE